MEQGVVSADLGNSRHAEAVLAMLSSYAEDPMGGGRPLAPAVRESLIDGLRQHPTTTILLAYQDAAPVGIALCFIGFSTFRAQRQ